MRKYLLSAPQKGAVLVVGLIMLALITLLVTSAFMMSTSNITAVGNMQFRNQAIAAADAAAEQVISSAFAAAPVAQSINVDINNDNTVDYIVSVAAPTCISATIASQAKKSSVLLRSMSNAATWNTVWDIDANVTDSVSGASAHIHKGIRVLLNQTEKDAHCA